MLQSHLLIEFYSLIYNCVIGIPPRCTHVSTYSWLMLSNGHCRLFTRNEKVSLISAVFAVTFFIVVCVISFTFDLVDWWGSYVFINSSASKMSTHAPAQIRVKRKSQPLILYHFFCMRSGRIDGYYHHHRVRSTPSRERENDTSIEIHGWFLSLANSKIFCENPSEAHRDWVFTFSISSCFLTVNLDENEE